MKYDYAVVSVPALCKDIPWLMNDLLSQEDHWDFFCDRSGHWRWIRTNPDGITTASSPKGFNTPEECIRNALSPGNGFNGKMIYLSH